jgi:very-short-patch-repair endonuclease
METLTSAQYRELYAKKPLVPSKKKNGNGKQLFEMEVILIDQGLKYKKEYVFHPKRKWRFDFAIVDKKIAIEYEGIFGGGKSRHTTVSGYTGDTEKYNEAAKLGWKVLRYTAKSYGKLIDDINEILKQKT